MTRLALPLSGSLDTICKMSGCCSLPKSRLPIVLLASSRESGLGIAARKSLPRYSYSQHATRSRSWHCRGEQRVCLHNVANNKFCKGHNCFRSEKAFTVPRWCYAKHRRKPNFQPVTSRSRALISSNACLSVASTNCVSVAMTNFACFCSLQDDLNALSLLLQRSPWWLSHAEALPVHAACL